MSFFTNSFMKDELFECIIMDKTTTSDGYGGVVTTWVDGAFFKAAIVPDSSLEASIAMAQTEINRYSVTTEKTIILQYKDVFKRKSDGRIFQVYDDGVDYSTPKISTLNMRQVKAKSLEALP